MLQGIYHVTFQSSLATVGEVCIVFDACGLHGANETHAFRGVQKQTGETLGLTVEVCYLQGEKYPSLGQLQAISIDLEVLELTPEGFHAGGFVCQARNIRLNVFGRKLADLAEPVADSVGD